MGGLAELALYCLNAIATDEQVLAFCSGAYGRPPTVIHGIDHENPPGQEAYPVVALTDIVRSASLSGNSASHTLGLLCAVKNEAVESAGPLTIYRGMQDAGELSELVEIALVRALRQRYPRINLDAETGVASDFPLFAGLITITAEAAGSSRTPLYR
jgi:hypothetical protein